MADAARRLATYDDLLGLPENVVGEIVDGELTAHPRPTPLHAIASAALGGLLEPTFRRGQGGPGGWVILDEPELHLRADILVPDLAGWRRERLSEVPTEAYFTLRPDWVCEVLSPGTAKHDRVRKLPAYARHGVPFAWLVDPGERTLEVMQLRDAKWTLLDGFEADAPVRAVPFDAIELELGTLWRL